MCMYYVVIGGSSALVFEWGRVAGVGGVGGTFFLSYLSVSAHYMDADIDMCQMNGIVLIY